MPVPLLQEESWWLDRSGIMMMAQAKPHINREPVERPMGVERPEAREARLAVPEDHGGDEIFKGTRRRSTGVMEHRGRTSLDSCVPLKHSDIRSKNQAEPVWHHNVARVQPASARLPSWGNTLAAMDSAPDQLAARARRASRDDAGSWHTAHTHRPSIAGHMKVNKSGWRTGDPHGYAIDNSPRPRPVYRPDMWNLKTDPEFKGYAKPPNEDIFGVPSPRNKPTAVDMSVAQWRQPQPCGINERDPNPYTLSGWVPKESPRPSPRRQVHQDLMIQLPSNAMDPRYDSACRELHNKNIILGEVEQPSMPTGSERTDVNRSEWRCGNSTPFHLNPGIIPAPRKNEPNVDTAWRCGDQSAFVLGDKAPPLSYASVSRQNAYIQDQLRRLQEQRDMMPQERLLKKVFGPLAPPTKPGQQPPSTSPSAFRRKRTVSSNF